MIDLLEFNDKIPGTDWHSRAQLRFCCLHQRFMVASVDKRLRRRLPTAAPPHATIIVAGSNRRNAYSRFPNWEAIITLMKRTMCICAILPILLLEACGGGSSPLVAASSAGPDYTAFANPTPVTIAGYSGDAMEPFISKDGQYLFFNNSNDPAVNTDLYYASRVDDVNFTFQGPVQGVNTPSLDAVASLDTLGNFYFISNRSYATTLSTIYRGSFAAGAVTMVTLVAGVSQQKAGMVNFDAEISADGKTLWFVESHFTDGSPDAADIAIADRQGDGFERRTDSASLLQTVNTPALEYAPCISADGLELLFTRYDPTVAGSAPAIYRATRGDVNSAFGAPQRVAAATGFVEAPTLSADGHSLYFHKKENHAFVIYRVTR
jgi:WD40-like Beta Propeller Repeat